LLANDRARTKQDRRPERRKDAEQDRKKDRKSSEQINPTDRAENVQQLCTEAGAVWQPESNQCTHGPDPLPPGFAVDQPVAPVVEAATPLDLAPFACDGDGGAGYRVQVLYVYPEGASRFSEYHQSFLTWTAEMDQIFQASAAETGGFRRVRFVHDNTCLPTVKPVEVPAPTIGTWGGLNAELQRQGFNSLERIYLMFVDTDVYYGVGSWWPDDSPDPNLNNSNVGRSYARVDNGCWAGWIAAHEVMHNLAIVVDAVYAPSAVRTDTDTDTDTDGRLTSTR
jgi:hypothetical protein